MFVPSPNHSSRRGVKPTQILLLPARNSFEAAKSYLCMTKSNRSVHYLVGKKGQVVQLVRDDRKAWPLDDPINGTTLSIMLEDGFFTKLPQGRTELTRDFMSDRYWVTYPMLQTVADLCVKLCKEHNIPVAPESFVGTMGSYFPWEQLRELIVDVYEKSTPVST